MTPFPIDMQTKFSEGDTVALKSGGNSMTVEVVDIFDSHVEYQCQWLVNGRLMEHTFKEQVLTERSDPFAGL
jgi:uncharacterized protein YodC (DUF2158 family)